MINNSFCMLRGTSGTGKGTRVSQLQMFLQTKFSWKTGFYQDFSPGGGEMTPVTLIFPELNIIFMGKWVRSHKSKLWSWTSLDHINSKWGSNMVGVFLDRYREFNVVCEGYPLTLGPKYRYDSILENYGFKNQLYQFYVYDLDPSGKANKGANIEQLQERMLGRSGSRIKGTCWGSNRAFYSEYLKQKEIITNNLPPHLGLNIKAELHRFDAPVTAFGESYLNFIGRGDLVPEFLAYSQEFTTLRHVDQPQDLKAIPFILEDHGQKGGSAILLRKSSSAPMEEAPQC